MQYKVDQLKSINCYTISLYSCNIPTLNKLGKTSQIRQCSPDFRSS